MGTNFLFRLAEKVDDSQARKLCRDAMEILHEADSRFSLYKANSEISQLNRREISWDSASHVQTDVRNQVEYWKQRTQGFFDPVGPAGVYDPSGLVKTWAATNAASYLEANGYRDFTLNAGGDVYLSAEVSSVQLKRVGISNLLPIASKQSGVNLVVDLNGTDFRGVATSGNIERGEHIWRKAMDLELPIQVTVVARDLITADIWATAIYSGGSTALQLMEEVETHNNAVALIFMNSGRILSSAKFTSVLGTI